MGTVFCLSRKRKDALFPRDGKRARRSGIILRQKLPARGRVDERESHNTTTQRHIPNQPRQTVSIHPPKKETEAEKDTKLNREVAKNQKGDPKSCCS